jgi:hypothetical protein
MKRRLPNCARLATDLQVPDIWRSFIGSGDVERLVRRKATDANSNLGNWAIERKGKEARRLPLRTVDENEQTETF